VRCRPTTATISRSTSPILPAPPFSHRAQSDHGREQRISVSLSRHRRPRQRQGALHDRA
jgi:hypothetical protein